MENHQSCLRHISSHLFGVRVGLPTVRRWKVRFRECRSPLFARLNRCRTDFYFLRLSSRDTPDDTSHHRAFGIRPQHGQGQLQGQVAGNQKPGRDAASARQFLLHAELHHRLHRPVEDHQERKRAHGVGAERGAQDPVGYAEYRIPAASPCHGLPCPRGGRRPLRLHPQGRLPPLRCRRCERQRRSCLHHDGYHEGHAAFHGGSGPAVARVDWENQQRRGRRQQP